MDVRGRVEGHIEKWLFRPGQEVMAGQPLYILDPRPLHGQVRQSTIHAPISGRLAIRWCRWAAW